MKITRRSPFSGRTNTLDIPITQEQYDRWRTSGMMIQYAFPNLSADHREFLLTGITPQEWADTFGEA